MPLDYDKLKRCRDFMRDSMNAEPVVNPNWITAAPEACFIISYASARHLPRRRRRKVERMRRKRALDKALEQMKPAPHRQKSYTVGGMTFTENPAYRTAPIEYDHSTGIFRQRTDEERFGR